MTENQMANFAATLQDVVQTYRLSRQDSPSAKLRAKADLIDAIEMTQAMPITVADKVIAFDKIETMLRDYIKERVDAALEGEWYEDDDLEHYLFEEAMMAIFGKEIFAALGNLDAVMSGRAK